MPSQRRIIIATTELCTTNSGNPPAPRRLEKKNAKGNCDELCPN